MRSSYADGIYMNPDSWIRRDERRSLALARAPFGYYSRLNPDRETDQNPTNSLSNWEVRQMTVLLEMPFVITFERRVKLFQSFMGSERIGSRGPINHITAFPSDLDHEVAIAIRVRRTHIYEDSFEKLSKENGMLLEHILFVLLFICSEPNLRIRLNVTFLNPLGIDELGVDGGGLSREFLNELLRSSFNPQRGFFIYTADKALYPNPHSKAVTPDYLNHYYFIGRILAKAISESMLVELHFAHFFLAKMVSRTGGYVGFDYLQSLDPELYWQLHSLKTYQGDVRELDLDFSIVETTFGETQIVDLKPNGHSIPVTEENRVEYVHLMANYKLNKQVVN
ncbi:unnamed protein product [Protopolystoma xenopodis]|uniref:HECT-type E3 ubiquitin transferase n=1 Tax=Protopolystoma xenopodis TaxID=117903 RepID=A0A3S5BP61_9PLAT|nr:unnamed protein product [Protopolystoma xenopodis]